MTATAPNLTQFPPDVDLEYDDWEDESTPDEDREAWDQKVLQIEALIRRLSLAELNTFAEAVITLVKQKPNMGVPATMLMSEEVLARDWNSPEDNAAWGSLIDVGAGCTRPGAGNHAIGDIEVGEGRFESRKTRKRRKTRKWRGGVGGYDEHYGWATGRV